MTAHSSATPASAAAAAGVTLDNCEREPIHIPGRIQNHGALLAFDPEGRLRHASANAGAMLVSVPALGEAASASDFGESAAVHGLLVQAAAALRERTPMPMAQEAMIGGHTFDVVPHGTGDLLVVEFERRPAAPADERNAFAQVAYRAMDRIKRQRNVEDLLAVAVEEFRALTGFDRVMAYRFRHDESGDVVVEARHPDLEPFQGRRYPASDIPAQARRLYVANTLRMIADVQAAPVPLLSQGTEPLDLSASVLRSVSPVHIEYLGNMGVGASMSVSIVINDKLWGMIACHHRTARQVPYAVRTACDVLVQLLAANLASVLSRAHAERTERVTALRARIIGSLLHSEDDQHTLASFARPLCAVMRAHAVVVSGGSRISVEGDFPVEAAQALVRWLNTQGAGQAGTLFNIHTLATLPAELAARMGIWCGVLGLCYDPDAGAWLLLLRKEQIETIHWGGRPEKEYTSGPMGPRLTPRGSFDVWKQTVVGTAVRWSATDLGIAQQLLDELLRAHTARATEMNRARMQLMAVLGHDLRDPLNSISMAARVLEKGEGSGERNGRIGQRIQSSSSRMQRLVSQVLDMSRLQSGLGLDLRPQPIDLVALINDLIDEAQMAHPGMRIDKTLPPTLALPVDPDRVAQVLSNLVSNARHHGHAGEPIHVHLHDEPDGARLEIRNSAPAIAPDTAVQLFSPFKRTSAGNARNRSGMGLGLYIAHQIVQGHGGTITYHFEEPHVVFRVRLPRSAGDAPTA